MLISLSVSTAGNLAQTASFGDTTAAGTGGWRPQLDSGAVESLTSYDSLVSGSLGSYTPTITSGRLNFTGGGAGAPNGAVLQCTGASGRVYNITIAEVANRRDYATNADIDAADTVSANLGLTLVIRQNAQIEARSRLTAGKEFLSANSQGGCDSGKASPITLKGEGSYVSGEHHIHSLRAFFPWRTTIDGLVFADQTTASSLLIESGSSRVNGNITVKNCRFEITYDVDGAGDWSTGFSSTGFTGSRFVYVTGGYTRNVAVLDNVMIGGFLQSEIAFDGYLWYLGNWQEGAYFDARKTSHANNIGPDTQVVRIEGGNFYGNAGPYSVNESAATEPHWDGDQVVSGGLGPLVSYYEANIFWRTNNVRIQNRFHDDRSSTNTGGHRWSAVGEFLVTGTTQCLSNDSPDNLYLKNILCLPYKGESLPLATARNTLKLGTAKTGNGQNIGTHEVIDVTFGDDWVNVGNIGSPTVSKTNYVDQSGYLDADYSAAVTNWASWSSMPDSPSFTTALTYSECVAAGVFENVTPFPYITAGSPQSEYTISSTIRPVPTLSALTVTTPATAAFTVTTDIVQNSTVFHAIFSTEVTDANAIRDGFNGATEAEDWGIAHRGNSSGSISGGGNASLSAGTYWLCVAQFNGPKKSDVVTVEFTV